jgi:hypothetical protein
MVLHAVVSVENERLPRIRPAGAGSGATALASLPKVPSIWAGMLGKHRYPSSGHSSDSQDPVNLAIRSADLARKMRVPALRWRSAAAAWR